MRPPDVLAGPRHEIGIDDARYPEDLKEAANPPKRLYLVGNPDALQVGLAVIGARKATPYGKSCARRFARIAAEKGACIISGGARGCDSEAHLAALEASAPTVVFLGGGCDKLYPKQNRALFQRVVDAGGAVVSERAWGTDPLPYMFRERNRLIAGLAGAVLIVEAGLPSGTFSTADDALSMGKEVLVVPGAITSSASAGSNRLLYQGAIPVVDDETFEDALFSVLGFLKSPGARKGCVSEEADAVIATVLAAPTDVESLYEVAVRVYGEGAMVKMNSVLAGAESRGIICRYADGRWGAVVPA